MKERKKLLQKMRFAQKVHIEKKGKFILRIFKKDIF